MHIIIDIGHAKGTGARGHGREEHAQSVETASAVRAALVRRGYKVSIIDFPEKSNRDDLNMTVYTANNMQADLGVSLHMDASDNKAACGAHVCYASAKGQQAAGCIANRICDMLPGRASKTVKRKDLFVLNQTKAVWVLVELGFITNAHDLGVVENEREQLAERLAAGISDYLNA